LKVVLFNRVLLKVRGGYFLDDPPATHPARTLKDSLAPCTAVDIRITIANGAEKIHSAVDRD
jgi:hypothetical protein